MTVKNCEVCGKEFSGILRVCSSDKCWKAFIKKERSSFQEKAVKG